MKLINEIKLINYERENNSLILVSDDNYILELNVVYNKKDFEITSRLHFILFEN